MRNGFLESHGAVRLEANMLEALQRKGYKYVQIKGLTTDKRYDYLSPHILLLVPMKVLPADPREKDIYEPIPSSILEQWAAEQDEHCKIFIAQI